MAKADGAKHFSFEPGTQRSGVSSGFYDTNGGYASLYGIDIEQNRAGVGGGFYVDDGEIDFDTCIISNNQAPLGAGGAWKAPGTYTVTACQVTDPIVQVQ